MGAIGRSPLTERLQLHKAGVSCSKSSVGSSTVAGYQLETVEAGGEKAAVEASLNQHIHVDDYQNTNIEGIYALGDVCGNVELTPMAIAAGRRLSDRSVFVFDSKSSQ